MNTIGTKTLLILTLIWAFCDSNPSCPKLKSDMINVHLVCHTHDDVGWLKTVDQYYYGARKRITWVGVQYILDSVVESLLKDKDRKFIFVESAFFFRWWEEQNENMKKTVKALVNSGQLEFIGGGWCMNDEAAAHYNAIIDQMTLGLTKLNKTFGEVAFPRIAWQIDPFGHSKEQASIFAQMGMDGLFFGRLDHDDKNNRWQNQKMEIVWKGSDSLGEESWLFTGVLPNGYSPPKGFCFDLLCADDPIMDDPSLKDYNKEKMIEKFLALVKEQSEGYATSNLIMTMGEDFNYVYAESWYKNLDKLIKYVNDRQKSGSNVNLVYSTPSCYLDALHAAENEWPTKIDDFFPYASDPHAYWTGYFTSRPTLKGLIRQSNNVLQASKQIAALSGGGYSAEVEKLMKAVAVAQHHDAVTGTAKQHVTDDYVERLYEGIDSAFKNMEQNIKQIDGFSQNHMHRVPSFDYCLLLNISSCPFTEKNKAFTVVVYNPLSRSRDFYIRIPVQGESYVVLDESNNEIESQVIPISQQVISIPGRVSSAKNDLIFFVENLLPLAVRRFLVRAGKNKESPKEEKISTGKFKLFREIKQGNLSLQFDEDTNKLNSIQVNTESKGAKNLKVKQDWMWYAGMRGNNSKFDLRASGAYIFRPDSMAKEFGNPQNTKVVQGNLVSEFHQVWNPWVSQIARLYKHKNFVEFEWLIGPIPVDDSIGKEVINRIKWEEFITNNTFYTDANGREMQKRILNERATWILNSSEPISQNYYPVTSRLNIHSTSGKESASILNERSQGGTSLSDGEMELMVHRRLLDDDAFGVGEPLNETAFSKGLVARGKHYLVHSEFSTKECDFGCQHRLLGEELLLQPVIYFASSAYFNSKIFKIEKKILNQLPINVRILTLEPWTENGKWLLRLENFFEAKESSKSGSAEVNIKDLFTNWKVRNIEELTLGANLRKKDTKRFKWKIRNENTDEQYEASKELFDLELKEKNGIYTFGPMQIRTFLLSVVQIEGK